MERVESLADILKHFPIPAGGERINQKMREILAHPQVAGLLKEHPGIDEAALRAHMPMLYEFVTEYDNCSNCPGLERCPNTLPGHYTRISVVEAGGNARLVDRKTACRKFRARQAEEAVRKRIRSFYVDDRVWTGDVTANEIVAYDKKREKAVLRLLDYILRTKEHGLQSKGLYLYGGFGTGKTFLTGYMLRELAKSGYSGVIVHMPDFAEDLKAMFQEPQKLKETIELLKTTDLLVFDDIGAENLNPWLRDHVLGSILNYRMDRKPTFYTSNYDLDRLELHMSFTSKEGEEEGRGRRIMERIRPYVTPVEVGGANKRG